MPRALGRGGEGLDLVLAALSDCAGLWRVMPVVGRIGRLLLEEGIAWISLHNRSVVSLHPVASRAAVALRRQKPG